ncbi:MAG: hypothetical protein AAF567_24525 [Actinomycetota bacterium]
MLPNGRRKKDGDPTLPWVSVIDICHGCAAKEADREAQSKKTSPVFGRLFGFRRRRATDA